MRSFADGDYHCPMEVTLQLIGGKWKPLIVYYLFDGTRRFGQLMRLLPNVTQRMLTRQLRELECDGLVHRKVYAQVPPKVEYSLTELGRSLEPLIERMETWGATYVERGREATSRDAPQAR